MSIIPILPMRKLSLYNLLKIEHLHIAKPGFELSSVSKGQALKR